MTRFTGFGAGAVAWFEGLQRDNSKAYVDVTRATWQQDVREPLHALLEELRAEFGGEVRLFRQHRDVRFSSDKSPYKTNSYGLLVQRAGTDAGLYVSVSAEGLEAATGYYQMARDQLQRYLAAVDDERSGPQLERVVAEVEAAGLAIFGTAVKTAPRGYRRDHPRIRLLRHKELMAGLDLPAGPELGDRRALEHVARVWRTAAPLNAWLDAYVGPSELSPEERRGRG